MILESKLPSVGTTIFTTMSALAQKHQAINLAQGFPDFPVDPMLLNLVNQAMQDGFNQYAPMAGMEALRLAIAEKHALCYGKKPCHETEITLTCGATEAVSVVIQTVVRKDDEVIFFQPAYDSYLPNICLAGGIPKPIPLRFPDYSIDFELLKKTISAKTRLIILNNPNNPTGAILSKEDVDQLASLIEGKPIFVLADEVYEHLVFDQKAHVSLLNHQLFNQAFITCSFGKTFHATGWRAGYCIAPASLSSEFRKIHQYVTFAIATPFQIALAQYMQNPSTYLDLAAFFQQKRDFFAAALQKIGLKPLPCPGTYFMLADYRALSTLGDFDFAKMLVQDFKVATVPVSYFYTDKKDDHVIRFCFAKKQTTLEQAIENLSKIV